MNKSEAGKLGAKITSRMLREAKILRIEKYNNSPKLCKECNSPLTYAQNQLKNICCSKVCAKTLHDKNTPKVRSKCRYCGKEIMGWKKYCNVSCQAAKSTKDSIDKALACGEVASYPNGQCNNKLIRKILEQTNGWKCSICLNTEWMEKKIPLHADHIDGNSTNNKIENFRWVCPNCDEQLPTWGRRNQNGGRHYRRKRYEEGKSR